MKNLAKTYDLTLISAYAAGLGFMIPDTVTKIKPGETLRLPIFVDLRQLFIIILLCKVKYTTGIH